MPRPSPTAAALLLGLALAGAPPALAAGAPQQESPEELARQGMERLMKALERFLETIPQYEMPEVTEDGDIIIRRKRPKQAPPPDPELEETKS